MLGTSSGLWNRGLLLTYYRATGRSVLSPGGNYSDNNGKVWMMEHYIPSDAAISTHTLFRDLDDFDDLNRQKQDPGSFLKPVILNQADDRRYQT
jgi:hypothetical protein